MVLPVTLIRRRKTIRSAILDVVLAPFVLMLIMAWVNRVWLALILALMLFSMWMAPEPAAKLIPDVETLATCLGAMAVIAIAAIPLAIRDYFSEGGYETVGQPTEGCLDAAAEYADQLIAGDIDGLYSSFSTRLRAEISAEGFGNVISAITKAIGPPVSIADLEELAIPEQVFTEPDNEPAFDCMVRVILSHADQQESAILLGLNSRHSLGIAKFQFEKCETRKSAG